MAELIGVRFAPGAIASGRAGKQSALTDDWTPVFLGMVQAIEKRPDDPVHPVRSPATTGPAREVGGEAAGVERKKGGKATNVENMDKTLEAARPHAVLDGKGDVESGQFPAVEDEAFTREAAASVAKDREAPAAGEEDSPQGEPLDGASFGLAIDQEEPEPLFTAPAVSESSSALELLGVDELLDPTLTVESVPGQLAERLQQALASGPGLDEELAQVVLPQVIRSMAALVRSGVAELRLQLQPADLGELELRVRTTQGAVQAEMMVQHPEIKQLIEGHLHRLRAALSEQGLQLQGCDVGVQQGGRFGPAEGFPQRSPARRSLAVAGRGRPLDEPIPETARRMANHGNHAVDYTI